MRNAVARVRSEGGRRQLGKVGDGRAEGEREGGREATMEERKNCGEEKRKRGKKGKFKMRGFLQSDVGRSDSERRKERGRREMTQDSSLAHFSPPSLSYPDDVYNSEETRVRQIKCATLFCGCSPSRTPQNYKMHF